MGLTLFYAQILGIYIVVTSLALLINKNKAKELMGEVKKHTTLLFVDGALALFFGTILILTHNFWVNHLSIAVSLVGWVIFITGVLELILPSKLMVRLYTLTQRKVGFVINLATLALGTYFALYGFGILSLV